MNPRGLHRLLHALWFGPVHATLTRELGARPGERVLDVGSGTGGLARRIAASGATVVCVEPDAGSLAVARERLAEFDAEFIEASVESLPLPAASVDRAVASVSAHHWKDSGKGFGELCRVLRPGGRLVIAEFRPTGLVSSLIRLPGGRKHGHAPDAATWMAEVTRAGFSDVRVLDPGWTSVLALFLRATR
jgi:ubiquinone/menaquinone biosynthesis C-methylase UbiE